MPLSRQRFLGASIISIGCNLGWNQQSSSLTVDLAEDPSNGDRFQTPIVGTPTLFQYETFSFGGLIQNWTYKQSTSGRIYSVNIVDPRELLENVKLILGEFNGSIQGIPNIVNCYGFLENTDGFGKADFNESGMPWNNILNALNRIFQTGQTTYGSRISFRGYNYLVSLEGMPVPPADYRVNGTSASLLEVISQVCDDCGHDFFVELVSVAGANVIRVRSVSRVDPLAAGKIARFIETTPGAVSREIGMELRNEKTTTFLVGGPVQNLNNVFSDFPIQQLLVLDPLQGQKTFIDGNIWPYWGLDQNNNTISGVVPTIYNGTTIKNAFFNKSTVTLDSRNVDVAGVGATYKIEYGELQAALISEDAWETYICARAMYANTNNLKDDPYFGRDIKLGMAGPYASKLKQSIISNIVNAICSYVSTGKKKNKGKPVNFLDANKKNALLKSAAISANPNDNEKNKTKLYGYVRSFAEEFYARKFMVRINTQTTRDDLGYVKSQLEPTDGGFVGVGETSFGVPASGKFIFSLPDNRITAFAVFPLNNDIDISRMSKQNYIISKTEYDASINTTTKHGKLVAFNYPNPKIYIKGELEQQLVFTNFNRMTSPRVVFTLSEVPALKNYADDKNFLAEFKAATANQVNDPTKAQQAAEKIALAIGSKQLMEYGTPLGLMPERIVIPLKDNTLRYGPWYIQGADGKVDFVEDETLVPWNYGGYATLNAAAIARVQYGITNMQDAEVGNITVPGAPTVSLGDVLITNGPNVTNITVQIGEQGVTTTYNCQTFSPSFGNLSKLNAERWDRLGKRLQQQRREMNARAWLPFGGAKQYANRDVAGVGLNFSNQLKSKLTKAATPHEVLVGELIPAISGDGFTPNIVTAPFYEALIDLRPEDDELYSQRAFMTWEGLLRPFTTKTTASGDLPHFISPSSDSAITANTLNPFKPYHDIEFIARGSGYPEEGMSLIVNEDYEPSGNPDYRGMALRGPLVLAGWGYTTDGKPVPNASGDNSTDYFASGYLRNCQTWPTGPVDLRWDNARGVWTSLPPEYPKDYTGLRICANTSFDVDDRFFSEEMSKDVVDGALVANRDKLFLTPHTSKYISLYNGTEWHLYDAIPYQNTSNIQLVHSKMPGHITASSLTPNHSYNVFCKLGTSVDGFRSPNIPQLFLVDTTISNSGQVCRDRNGIWVRQKDNTGGTTPESRDRFLGMVIIDDDGRFQDCETHRFVFNQYNPIMKHICMIPSSTSTILSSGLRGLWANDKYHQVQLAGAHWLRARFCATFDVYDPTDVAIAIVPTSGGLGGFTLADTEQNRWGNHVSRHFSVISSISGIALSDSGVSSSFNTSYVTRREIFTLDTEYTLPGNAGPHFSLDRYGANYDTSYLNSVPARISLSPSLCVTNTVGSSGNILGCQTVFDLNALNFSAIYTYLDGTVLM